MKKLVLLKSFVLSLICTLSFSAHAIYGNTVITETSVVTGNFNVNANASMFINMREASVNITTWAQNRVEVKVTLTVEALDKEDIDKFFKEVIIKVNGNAENVMVSVDQQFSGYLVLGTRKRLRTKNQGLLNIRNYSYQVEVKMPETNQLNLKNKFGDVLLGTHRANLDLELYECKFNASQIDAKEALMTLKFSKGMIGKTQNLKLEAYEVDATFGTLKNVSLNAKFSKLTFPDVSNVTLINYESTLIFANVKRMSGQQNFGSLTLKRGKNVKLNLYEVKLNAERIDSLVFNSIKFSKVNVNRVMYLNAVSAYESDFNLEAVKWLKTNDKFGKYNIETLEDTFVLDGYESNCDLVRVSPKFQEVEIMGKFNKANIGFYAESAFKFNVDTKFTSVSYPSDKFEIKSQKKENSNFTLKAKSKGNVGNGSIAFKGYEGKIAIFIY